MRLSICIRTFFKEYLSHIKGVSPNLDKPEPKREKHWQ